VDEDGNRWYRDDDYETVQTFDSRLVSAIFAEVETLNGLDALEDDAKKNSAAANGKQHTD